MARSGDEASSGTAGPGLIEVEGVGKTFHAGTSQAIEALADVDIQVGRHEFVSIVGRSGCGKSTLLRLIAGLVPPTRGSLRVEGRAVTAPRRNISLMFQRPALFPWRTVLDNTLFPIEILGRDREAYRERAHDLLDLVGLNGFADRRPKELSGGMQQRAALCRALVHDPDILLMDEPFAALDALTREELSAELQRLWTETRKTIVFVTHSIPEAVTLSDRVITMTPRPGRIASTLRIDMPRPRTEATPGLAHYKDAVRQDLFGDDGPARSRADVERSRHE